LLIYEQDHIHHKRAEHTEKTILASYLCGLCVLACGECFCLYFLSVLSAVSSEAGGYVGRLSESLKK